MNKFIGRHLELEQLNAALQSSKAEMIAVIGRRRVGKTYLIQHALGHRIVFEVTGVQNATRKQQLINFSYALRLSGAGRENAPKDWMEAFFWLTELLQAKALAEKPVIFLDELPWLATHRSGFLQALSWFWNSWAVKRKIVLVICGSAASWMINKVVNHKGGLHNRLTRRINLKPFQLFETQEFLSDRRLHYSPSQIVELYMVTGGIPLYLNQVRPGISVAQNIDQMCFSDGGLLKDEFNNLFAALFTGAEKHISIIRALANHHYGLTRKQLINKLPSLQGRALTQVLKELVISGFVTELRKFGNDKASKHYRLTDEYSLFYIKFIEPRPIAIPGVWLNLSQTQGYSVWSGYAFENVVIKHIPQIKQALGISGVYSETSTYMVAKKEDKPGVQIDLILDRKDRTISLCEIKFSQDQIRFSKEDELKIRQKISAFKMHTNTRKSIILTVISPFGILKNQYSLSVVGQSIKANDVLFQEPINFQPLVSW
ncbi:MAG: ATP-binding protein [Bacteroidota bacterium]